MRFQNPWMPPIDWNGVDPIVDQRRCVACKLCMNVCPTNALIYAPEGRVQWGEDDPGTQTAAYVRIDLDNCINCGACEPECPYNAIFGDFPSGSSSGGGSEPGTGGSAPPPTVYNNVKNPCLNKSVNNVMNNNRPIKGTIADIIKNFDSNKKIDLKILDGNLTYNNGQIKPAQTTDISFNPNTGVFSATITLNPESINNTSYENLTSILIHEFVHAYLSYTGKKFDNSQASHNLMARDYIIPMANYLTSVFGIPEKDAFSLAWSGVPDADVFKNAADTDTFPMNDGRTITKDEAARNGAGYRDDDPKFQKGKPLEKCNN